MVQFYGYCPVCGIESMLRERKPNGNDRCRDGHTYPSAEAMTEKQRSAWIELRAARVRIVELELALQLAKSQARKEVSE